MISSQALVAASGFLLKEKKFGYAWRSNGMIESVKLVRLLRLVWSSPIFGDAFPPDVSTRQARVVKQVEAVYLPVVSTLEPLLAQAMPLPSVELSRLVQEVVQIIPAFCSAIVAGEVDDPQLLRAAAINTALMYLFDQMIDGGDEAPLAAVLLLNDNFEAHSSVAPEQSSIQNWLMVLQWIKREVSQMSCLEDQAVLLECGSQVLQKELTMYEYEQGWRHHQESHVRFNEIAQAALVTTAILHTTATLYAIYRKLQPELPGLSEIFNQQRLMEVLNGPCNAVVRVLDDANDQSKDNRQHFNLNIFNQQAPDLVEAFLRQAGLNDASILQSMLKAFQANTETDQAYLRQAFVDLAREQLAALPAPLWNRYGVFLTLVKRVMEASYVNFMSDRQSAIASL